MKHKIYCAILVLTFTLYIHAQDYRLLESTADHVKLEFDFNGRYSVADTLINGNKFNYIAGQNYCFRMPGEPWLPDIIANIGVPRSSNPVVKVLSVDQQSFQNVLIIPFPDSLNQPFSLSQFNQKIYGVNKSFPSYVAGPGSEYIMRYIRVIELSVSPFQFNPVNRSLVFNKKVVVEVDFQQPMQKASAFTKINDNLTNEFVNSNVINKKEALSFTAKSASYSKVQSDSSYWYTPNKDFYKIYLSKEGIYRVTYNQLISAGISPSSGIQQGKLELYNNGVRVPLDIVDVNKDALFDGGDYFQFVGYPPKSSPYCYLNIYNLQNVYWLSYQADSVYSYKYINGNPVSFTGLQASNWNVLHFEKDLDYERLGYAPDGNRDFWLWDKAEASNNVPTYIFTYKFDYLDPNINSNLTDAEVKVKLQGITTTFCSPSHNVFVNLNGQRIGTIQFDGENDTTFVKDFKFGYYTWSPDSVRLLWGNNYFEVGTDGNVCSSNKDDIVEVDWFEFGYWRWNRVGAGSYIFSSPPKNIGPQVYYLWQWDAANMKVYIPSRGEVIDNPLIKNDADKSVYFADTVSGRTEYLCVSDTSFLTPDKIVRNTPSDLRNVNNGADYIIITYPDFMSAAQRLANYRSKNLQGFSSPRIKIVNINDIYNEFSYGLLDPYSLYDFVKYAFDYWQKPAPSYVVLLGDMSYDYRHIYGGSRPDFIPSIPFQSLDFGQAASDNAIVAVSGNDIVPDLAIGRLSCETLDEANILVDKIVNYPADNSKAWKKNVLLMASGMDAEDESTFGFNDQSVYLQDNFLAPNGMDATNIFRYPNKPEYMKYQGGGPEIRNAFDQGAVLANYYGHGGGGQWDLVFTNDDIYQLTNQGRLPLIISVTCYTAHFDNQDIFGEIFNKVPGKGSIGFFGSSGLTFWDAGVQINKELFDQIFNYKDYVFGNAVMYSKANVPQFGYYLSQVALLTLLGDPALELAIPKYPDFAVNSSDISISPSNPVKGDTVSVKVKVRNYGINFPDRAVTVQLYQELGSAQTLIKSVQLPSFADIDSVTVPWIPADAGLYQLIAKVNAVDTLWETDHSDNTAYANFAVYNFGEPNIVKPLDGYYSSGSRMNFVFTDIGAYINKSFSYYIEIDTSLSLSSPSKIISPVLSPVDGVVKWQSPVLNKGAYFWRAVIFDNTDTNRSSVRTFTIGSGSQEGYYAEGKQLMMFPASNVFYSDSANELVMNTTLLPPRPSDNTFIDSVKILLPNDAQGITTFTTDGTYFYFGNLPYYSGGQKSKIYKIGTGLNGSVKGKNYGAIPNLSVYIMNQIFYYSDGFLYAATGQWNSLLKIDPVTGDTSRVYIPAGLLPSNNGLLTNGGYYLTSDGRYVYNLSAGYGNLAGKYVMRTFDPLNGWQQVGQDIVFSGSSDQGFSGFFVVDGYLFTYESYDNGYLRRYRIQDGSFEEQWLSSSNFKNYYTWSYDWKDNFVYSSTFRPTGVVYIPGFQRFSGTYKDASGTIETTDIGPADAWNSIQYNFNLTGSKGTYKAVLLGRNINSKSWDTLNVNLQPVTQLSGIDPNKYNYLKIYFSLVDSSFGASQPLRLKSVQADYSSLPEISISKNELSFSPDSVLQGLPVKINVNINNLGYSAADSLKVKFYLNYADSAFYTKLVNIPADSSSIVSASLQTNSLTLSNNIKVVAASPSTEFYTFNNIVDNNFYVSVDSVKPSLFITFDGKEITNGDIISAKPKILIRLKDNSPLPLDTTDFSIVFDNNPLNFNRTDIRFSYTPYPNSEADVTWAPALADGKHTMDILARDGSGNFNDSAATHVEFYVYNQSDLRNVYNYPNPFKSNTYFTFQLTGSQVPDELSIRIFTVAGRLIKTIPVPPSDLKIGFNKVYWDGRDQDGDNIANGLYFYKIIYKNGDVVKSQIQKLAKVE